MSPKSYERILMKLSGEVGDFVGDPDSFADERIHERIRIATDFRMRIQKLTHFYSLQSMFCFCFTFSYSDSKNKISLFLTKIK